MADIIDEIVDADGKIVEMPSAGPPIEETPHPQALDSAGDRFLAIPGQDGTTIIKPDGTRIG